MGGKKLTNPGDIAEGFNDHLANIGSNVADEIGTTTCNFHQHIKKANSEFTTFEPVTIDYAYIVSYVSYQARKLLV